MITLNTFKKILKENNGKLPLLTLEEFFKENIIEDSIAPNQWDYGRPSINEIYNSLKKIETLPHIAWVRVTLHYDTEIEIQNGKETLNLAGDTIIICTNAQSIDIENLIDCNWLCADGIITTNSSELNNFSCVPSIPENFHCLEIVWD